MADHAQRKHVPIDRETVVDRNAHPPLGPTVLQLPEGEALCHDAVSLTVLTAERGSGERFVIVAAAAQFGCRNLGSLSAMTPDQARNLAASLIGAADAIDGGMRVN